MTFRKFPVLKSIICCIRSTVVMCHLIKCIVLQHDSQQEHTQSDADDQVSKFIQLKKEIFPKVKDNVAAAQRRQKVHYDSRHQQGSYEAGDLVLVKNLRKLSKKGDKMKPNWTGPYEVIEQVGKTNYRLKNK